jgi:hypothetical protein
MMDDEKAGDGDNLLEGVQPDDAAPDGPALENPFGAQPEDKEAERPAWLPEKYKTPEDFRKSYDELHKVFRAGKHKAPEDGKYDLEPLKELNINPDDAVMKAYTDWAKQYGIGQKAFEDLARQVAGLTKAEVEVIQTNIKAEREALGPKAEQRIKSVVNWMSTHGRSGVFSKDELDELRILGGTAKGIQVIEKLMGMVDGKVAQVAPIDVTAAAKSGRSPEELNAMVADPRFLKDPAYRKQVEQAFEAVYGSDAA